MKNQLNHHRFDWVIAISTTLLLVIGFLLQSSIAYKSVGIHLDLNLFTQVAALILGIAVGVIFLMFKPSTWRKRSFFFLAAVIVLLILVLVIGSDSGGAQRWLSIGSWQIQPTEIAKLSLIFVLASILDTHALRANRLSTVVTSLLVTLVIATLVAVQPDLGSAIVMIVIWLAMMLASRINLSRFTIVLISLAVATVVFVPFLAEYQQERLVSYFNPTKDVSGANYNVVQANIAIGSGGLTGNGLEAGTQSQLNFLPSQHTDFIFAVLAEKLGLIGAGLVLIAFTVLITRLIFRAWQTTNQYIRLILVGFSALLIFHTFVNIGMNMGLVPVTGLPLPYLSYGGTFLFTVMFISTLAFGLNDKQTE
jgi:rod shape determining protein RodA